MFHLGVKRVSLKVLLILIIVFVITASTAADREAPYKNHACPLCLTYTQLNFKFKHQKVNFCYLFTIFIVKRVCFNFTVSIQIFFMHSQRRKKRRGPYARIDFVSPLTFQVALAPMKRINETTATADLPQTRSSLLSPQSSSLSHT